MVLLDTEGMVRSRDPSDPASKRAPKRERTSAPGDVAPDPASTLESPNAAEEALVQRAQEEVSQSYQKAQGDRAVAQRKANEKARIAAEQARVAAAEAQTLRKDMAVQAETDLYGFKSQALRATLEQVAEARAAGVSTCSLWTHMYGTPPSTSTLPTASKHTHFVAAFCSMHA